MGENVGKMELPTGAVKSLDHYHMKASLAVRALQNAVDQRNPACIIVHSYRGSQFRSKKFVKRLSRNGLNGSMGSVGAYGDNAAMETFFALLQKNVLDQQRWSTREQLRMAIVIWIEQTYHRKRRQPRLGKLTLNHPRFDAVSF